MSTPMSPEDEALLRQIAADRAAYLRTIRLRTAHEFDDAQEDLEQKEREVLEAREKVDDLKERLGQLEEGIAVVEAIAASEHPHWDMFKRPA